MGKVVSPWIKVLVSALLLLTMLIPSVVMAEQQLELDILDQTFSINRYAAQGKQLAIWVAPTTGSRQRIYQTAKKLAEIGVESWVVDLAENLFLPTTTSTLRTLDGRYVAGLITAAYQHSGKQITLIGRAYGALPVLRGARLWQRQQRGNTDISYFTGVLLFSPELYRTIPALGLEAEYASITTASTVPIIIVQAAKRGNRWQLNTLVEKLQQGGAPVFVKITPGVTGLFYMEDNAPQTLKALRDTPAEIKSYIALLNQVPTSLRTVDLATDDKPETNHGNTLVAYQGNINPQPLDLMSITGKRVRRQDYVGKVTVINFWASWCPPCVEEIPSLNNLRTAMSGKNFELISVNYAEDKKTVENFLTRVKVDFPVLLDEDGSVAAKWKVLVYPSTFVIGTDGLIKYGISGGVRWDSPDVMQLINTLL